jgi:hypothetical protein
MKKILNEELSIQLRLISYDRSLTLYEQPINEVILSSPLIAPIVTTKPYRLANNIEDEGWYDITSALHFALPVTSIAIGIFGAPVVALSLTAAYVISVSLELIDASIYLAQDRYYEAGLAFIFAFAGPFSEVLQRASKGTIKIILNSLKNNKKIPIGSDADKLIKEIIKNPSHYTRLARRAAAQKYAQQILNYNILKMFINVNNTTKGMIVLGKIVKIMSFIKSVFALTIELSFIIGGGFYTWDYIANKLDICNPIELKKLKDSNWTILKIIGQMGENVQPFSVGCEMLQHKKLIEDTNKKLKSPKENILVTLNNIIDRNLNVSIKAKEFQTVTTLCIQYLLHHLGFSKVESFEEKNKELINTNKVYSLPAAKDWDPKDKYYKDPLQKTEYGNNVQYKKNQYGQWFKYNNLAKSWEYLNNGFDRGRDVAKELFKQFKSDDGSWVKGNPLSSVNVGSATTKYYDDRSKSLTKNLHYFKFGYYDYNTEEMVKRYQKNKNISKIPDGIVGPITAKQMISDLKKITEIENYNNFDFTKDKYTSQVIVNENLIKKIKADNEKQVEIDLRDKEVSDSIINQVKIKCNELEMQLDTVNIKTMNFTQSMYDIEQKIDTINKQ